MPEQDNDRHIEQPVDGAGDAGKLCAIVLGFGEGNGKKQKGIDLCAVPTAISFKLELEISPRSGAYFGVGQLKQEVTRLPGLDQGVLFV